MPTAAPYVLSIPVCNCMFRFRADVLHRLDPNMVVDYENDQASVSDVAEKLLTGAIQSRGLLPDSPADELHAAAEAAADQAQARRGTLPSPRKPPTLVEILSVQRSFTYSQGAARRGVITVEYATKDPGPGRWFETFEFDPGRGNLWMGARTSDAWTALCNAVGIGADNVRMREGDFQKLAGGAHVLLIREQPSPVSGEASRFYHYMVDPASQEADVYHAVIRSIVISRTLREQSIDRALDVEFEELDLKVRFRARIPLRGECEAFDDEGLERWIALYEAALPESQDKRLERTDAVMRAICQQTVRLRLAEPPVAGWVYTEFEIVKPA